MFVHERFELQSHTVYLLQAMKPSFGYNGFGEFIFRRTYSRIRADGGQESWNDCVIRVINGVFSIRKDWYIKNHIEWDESFWQSYAHYMAIAMFEMKWLPPGRGLWAMGSDFVYERGSMALQNCGFKVIGDDIGNDVHWVMDALMCGVGVGFEPARNDSMVLHNPQGIVTYEIPDSREGWIEGVRRVINSRILPGQPMPDLKFHLIRPSGLPIKGFGGISSGPEPLMQLIKNIWNFFEMYEKYDWYDSVMLKADIVNAVGCCVIAGNVRRSAELMSGPIDDVIDMKNYDKYPHREFHGHMSNNSVILTTNSDFERIGEIAERIKKNGEPGFINRRNMPYGRIGKPLGDLRLDRAIGFNPCLRKTSKLLTKNGIRNLEDCKEGDYIWSEMGWTKIVKKWSTGINPISAYHTTAGVFYGTGNHRVLWEGIKVEVNCAPGIDILAGEYKTEIEIDSLDVMDGLVLGDGSNDHGRIILYIGENDQDYLKSEVANYIKNQTDRYDKYNIESRIDELPLTYNREIPDRYLKGNRNIVCGFLRGLFSANGCVTGNRIQLKTSSFRLLEQVQMMLSSIGIKSYYTTNKPTLVRHKNGEFLSKQSYDLSIAEDRVKFQTIIGFIQNYKNEKLDQLVERINPTKPRKRTYDIHTIIQLGEEETFDITVDNSTHTYWTQGCNVSNCGEQPLEDGELCTLVETCPTRCDSIEDWHRNCEYATMYASTVTLLPTHRHETNAVMIRNRRIGVGIIDVVGFNKLEGTTKLIKALREGYDRVRDTNNWANDEAGIPRSIRVTTIKPGGTTPKLPGLRSGWSWPTFGLTKRRVRVAQNQPIHKILADAGVPFEKDIMSMNTDCFEWPIDQSDGGAIKPATEISLWQQAMMLVLLQREWSDNAVSNTLYFRPMWSLTKVIDLGPSFYDIDPTVFYEVSLIVGELSGLTWRQFLETQEVEERLTKIKLVQNKWSEHFELQVYQYDKDHEEDDVESVLAAIAPLTKSVSMLPHMPKGVYLQSPEEELSLEEYNQRLSQIKPIDWSQLSGSDGMDEKYCSGDSCEIQPNKVSNART